MKQMDTEETAEPIREAAHAGREMGFYYRELATGAAPDWKRATGIMSRLLNGKVETVEDVLALVVAVRTMLGNSMTDELYDADVKMWTEFFAMHSLLDRAVKTLEMSSREPAGDFDGTIPASH